MRLSARIWGDDRWLDVLVVWTFVAAGLAPLLPLLVRLPLLEAIPYLQFLLFLPAVIAGGLAFLARPHALRAWPMIAVIMLMVIGLLWTYPTERGRGMVELALVATPVPIAFLLQRRREWLAAVATFIVASTVAAIILFFDWIGQAERTGLVTDRYGGLYDEHIVRIMEPNITATHLGFGVLLIAIFWAHPALGPSERRWRIVATSCLPVLVIGVILSASRGGSLSLLGALTMLAIFTSVRRSIPWRINVLGATALLGIAALLLLVPNPVSNRITSDTETTSVVSTTGSGSTRTFGDRTATWRAALEASGSSSSTLLIGAGTGGADHAVAVANPQLHIAQVGEHNVIRANAHNTYLYWLVSYGIVGAILGVMAVMIIGWYALGSDWHYSWGAGTAMLTFFLLTSVTLIATRLEITSIAVAALTLGHILPRPRGQVRS